MFKSLVLMLLLIISSFTLSSCYTEAFSSSIESETSQILLPETPLKAIASPPASTRFSSMESLLLGLAAERFDEVRRFSPGLLEGTNELMMPYNVPENFALSLIVLDSLYPSRFIDFDYNLLDADLRPRGSTNAFFTWHHILSNNSGSDAEFHYYQREFAGDDSVRWLQYRWSQHGYEFSARIDSRIPGEKAQELINAFTNPQPVADWEIQGNSVSVSVQGMESITIIGEKGHEIVSTATTEPNSAVDIRINSTIYDIRSIRHHSLYKNYDGGLTRAGYSWLTGSENPSRRQFVLQPGTYTFHVEGIIDEPELLIRHFYNREVVSSVDFTEYLASQNFTSFTVTVTPDNTGSGDTVVINP